MITLQGEISTDGVTYPIAEIVKLYHRNKGRVEPNIDDVMELLSVVKVDINHIKKIPYAPYWDFLDEVANNIETGKWTMHPYNWKTYIMNASYLPMTDIDIEKRHDALRNKCINMLRESNLPINGLSNKQILLRWIRNPNGFQDILSTVKTMVELNKLFSKKEGK